MAVDIMLSLSVLCTKENVGAHASGTIESASRSFGRSCTIIRPHTSLIKQTTAFQPFRV